MFSAQTMMDKGIYFVLTCGKSLVMIALPGGRTPRDLIGFYDQYKQSHLHNVDNSRKTYFINVLVHIYFQKQVLIVPV